jgi:hypothetical protein
MRYVVAIPLLVACVAQAQNVGVNPTGAAPDASAMLDVSATDRGVLIPRVALTAANVAAPVTTPVASLLVYNTATAGAGTNAVTPGYYYWSGAPANRWIRFAADGDAWRTTGNAGTVAATNFLGTTDNVALRIRTNNTERFEFSTAGPLRAFANGTATAPAYSWTANTNTGLFQQAANVLGFSTNGTERFRIPNANQVHAVAGGTAALPFYSWSGDPNTGMFNAGADILAFSTNAAERMRINAAGQVLVNTAAPTEPNQFEVRVATGTYWAINAYNATPNGGSGFFHNTAVSGYNALEGVTNGTNSGVWGWHNNTIGNGYGVRGTTANPALAWAGYFQGDVGCTGLYYSSDERFKRDIATLDGGEALAKVMALAPRSYKYDVQRYPGMGFHPDRLSYGFIAQELKEVVPDLVMTKAIPDPTRSASARSEANNVEGYHMVNYIELIPIMTKAIQEQQRLIEEQRARIADLEKRLNDLKEH